MTDLIGPVRFRGKHGFINRAGEWVIEPTFDDLGGMHEGLASFASSGKMGFIDRKGNVIIEPQFEIPANGCWQAHFRDGLAAINVKRSARYIDRTGKTVIGPIQGALGWDFVLGMAVVSSEHWLVIDKTGNQLSRLDVYEVPYVADWPRDWECFNCWFSAGNSLVAGAMNWRGEIVFPPKYGDLGDFFQGIAPFAEEEDHSYFGPWGLVSLDGTIVLQPRFRKIGGFSEGLAATELEKKKAGFIDTTGEFVIAPVFDQACSFSEGLACVTFPNAGPLNKGFINTKGETVIAPGFRRETAFINGVAWVEFEKSIGCIDVAGRLIWERPFEHDPKYNLMV